MLCAAHVLLISAKRSRSACSFKRLCVHRFLLVKFHLIHLGLLDLMFPAHLSARLRLALRVAVLGGLYVLCARAGSPPRQGVKLVQDRLLRLVKVLRLGVGREVDRVAGRVSLVREDNSRHGLEDERPRLRILRHLVQAHRVLLDILADNVVDERARRVRLDRSRERVRTRHLVACVEEGRAGVREFEAVRATYTMTLVGAAVARAKPCTLLEEK